QGLSQRQIAELLDVPETTVETRLARARRMLRRIVSEAEAEDGGRTMAGDGEARRPRPIEAGDFR
ncbi:MAG: Sigma-70, region 4, partial [Planctomycetota bacterium]